MESDVNLCSAYWLLAGGKASCSSQADYLAMAGRGDLSLQARACLRSLHTWRENEGPCFQVTKSMNQPKVSLGEGSVVTLWLAFDTFINLNSLRKIFRFCPFRTPTGWDSRRFKIHIFLFDFSFSWNISYTFVQPVILPPGNMFAFAVTAFKFLVQCGAVTGLLFLQMLVWAMDCGLARGLSGACWFFCFAGTWAAFAVLSRVFYTPLAPGLRSAWARLELTKPF